jgi:1-acyl-sn-glycerol-3-phosphate acyltransferase
LLYKFGRVVLSVLFKLLYFYKIIGRENIPPGGFLACANHTGLSDPIFVGIALDTKVKLHFMAKVELFKNKFVAFIVKRLHAFPVKRGEADMRAVKESIRILKNNERLLIFPEGTRNSDDGAKAGAGMLALHTGCEILPIYISPGRKPFRKVKVIIGKSYKAEPGGEKASAAKYHKVADEILRRVYELGAAKS